MKYNLKAFNNAVSYYEQQLQIFRNKGVFVVFEAKNDKAFFSIAPLSRALHNLGCEMNVRGTDGASPSLDALADVWKAFDDFGKGIKSKKTIALDNFIKEADKKAKGEIRKIFRKPEVFIKAGRNGFVVNDKLKLSFRQEWFRKYKWQKLLETARIIWTQVYNLKKSEKVGVGFDLILRARNIKYPLEDYLDSYAIARAVWVACYAKKKPMSAYTSKKTMLEKSERTSELAATLLGCELEKDINEPVFRKFKVLSKLLRLNRFDTNDAAFFIKGEGFPGKHIFGETIGYPTPNNKSDKIIVHSNKTNLEVSLIRKNREKVVPMNSDVDVRQMFDPKSLKKGIKAGTYANIPGGEMFLSPEWMKGVFYGDVVISIDKSYVLNSRNPLVIKCDENGYKIISGPNDIIKKIDEKKKEAMQVLLKQEKNKSLPKEIIKLKKANFNHIGEFAVNTNPKAELCNYLIVNEKIAGMIHIALGSGFEDDRATVYHYDIVINAKEQKLNIYGVKGKKKFWMLKKGKLIV